MVSSGTLPVLPWLPAECHHVCGLLCLLSGPLHTGLILELVLECVQTSFNRVSIEYYHKAGTPGNVTVWVVFWNRLLQFESDYILASFVATVKEWCRQDHIY